MNISDVMWKHWKPNPKWKVKPKFLPCPFCGSQDIGLIPTEIKGATRILCTTCNANRTTSTKYKGQLEAEWNHRPNESIQ